METADSLFYSNIVDSYVIQALLAEQASERIDLFKGH